MKMKMKTLRTRRRRRRRRRRTKTNGKPSASIPCFRTAKRDEQEYLLLSSTSIPCGFGVPDRTNLPPVWIIFGGTVYLSQ
jgi:hypothetical protein